MNCDRRTFLKHTAIAVASASALGPRLARAGELPTPTAAKLPRWKGFNLLEKFIELVRTKKESVPIEEEVEVIAVLEAGSKGVVVGDEAALQRAVGGGETLRGEVLEGVAQPRAAPGGLAAPRRGPRPNRPSAHRHGTDSA